MRCAAGARARLEIQAAFGCAAARRWDLRTKPSAPAARVRQGGAVVGLATLNERHLLSAGADGRLLLWDVRRPAHPLRTVASPDGRSALALLSRRWLLHLLQLLHYVQTGSARCSERPWTMATQEG